MDLKDKFKQSGIKQFLEEISVSKNIYKSYGRNLAANEQELDLNLLKDKSRLINHLRRNRCHFEKDNSW